MKPSPISVAMLLVCLFLASAALAQTPAAANQSAVSSAQSASPAEVPRLIKFSGTLLDALDRPMAGPVGVTFALHAQQTGGAALWMETQNVTPDAHGFYTVLLGANSANGVPAELFASGEARWLEVQVEQQAEQPRVLLVSVPYALKAKDAETLGGKPASAFLTTETLATTSSSGAATSSNASATLLSSHSATTPKSAAATATINGTGTANFIAKFKDAADIQNSAIFESGGNVSIGTTSGNSPLTVTAGSAPLPVVLGLPTVAKFASPSGTVPWGLKQNAPSLNTPTLMWFETADGPVGFIGAGGTNILRISGFTGNSLALGSNTKTQVLIDTSGGVNLNGSLNLPTTSNTASGPVGVISLGGIPFVHNFGTSNTFVGASAGNFSMTGINNSAFGNQALQSNTTGGANNAYGVGALAANTTGISNTAMGAGALNANSTGASNSAFGYQALRANTTDSNSAFGANALFSNTTGGANSAFGDSALSSNTLGFDNAAFGLNALALNTTASNNSAFGFSALSANTTACCNSAFGSAALQHNTADNNAAFGASALNANTTGASNAAFGTSALSANTTGNDNSAFGSSALLNNTTGGNSAFGRSALESNTMGAGNAAFGSLALQADTTGGSNSAFGNNALFNLTSGSGNIAIGAVAGNNLTGSEGGNIDIGNAGVIGESSAIRIGTAGTQTKAFIAGIRGITTGQNNAIAVLIDSNGQLGTTSSSRRFKYDIHDMGEASNDLLRLRPVAFRYKQAQTDGSHPLQYGLIAEEVAEVFPELVAYGRDGQPETVLYHLLPAILLNEVQKQRQLVEEQRQANEEHQSEIEKQSKLVEVQRKLNEEQQSTIARQQAEIQDLAARLAKLEALVTPAP